MSQSSVYKNSYLKKKPLPVKTRSVVEEKIITPHIGLNSNYKKEFNGKLP